MIFITLAIIGLLVGAYSARKRGGNRKDIAQYAIGYAMAFSIVGMVLTVIAERLATGI